MIYAMQEKRIKIKQKMRVRRLFQLNIGLSIKNTITKTELPMTPQCKNICQTTDTNATGTRSKQTTRM